MVVKVHSALEVCDFMKRHSLSSFDSNFELAGLRYFKNYLIGRKTRTLNFRILLRFTDD